MLEPMDTVTFMYVVDFFEDWSESLIELGGGFFLFAITITVITREAPWLSLQFQPKYNLEILSVKFGKYLAFLSLFVALVLIIAYTSGANLYQCGKPWLYTTIAYLHDAPVEEWWIACMYCVYVTYIAYFIANLRERHQENKEAILDATVAGDTNGDGKLSRSEWITMNGTDTGFDEADIKHDGQVDVATLTLHRHLTLVQWLYAVTLYLPVVCLLSTATIMDAISNTVPPDGNILGLNEATLAVVTVSAAPILYLVKAYAIPRIANLTIKTVAGSIDGLTSTTATLIIIARVFLTVIFPCVAAFVMSQNCYGLWHGFWTPCQTPSNFNSYVDIQYSFFNTTVQTLSGPSVCGPNYRHYYMDLRCMCP